jgi:hypothetical protein
MAGVAYGWCLDFKPPDLTLMVRALECEEQRIPRTRMSLPWQLRIWYFTGGRWGADTRKKDKDRKEPKGKY